MVQPGMLVLVVGPSGAGKDTLMRAAQQELAGDRRFVFPRRQVTRESVAALEDHDSISREAFEALRGSGQYTLAWEAHGLGYVLPQSVAEDVASGRIAVCNVSRRVIPEVLERFPASRVIAITAERHVRARRLAARGRESAAEVVARLMREAPPVPEGVAAMEIDNSGVLGESVADFVDGLRALASGGRS